jgi:hypothetical protein
LTTRTGARTPLAAGGRTGCHDTRARSRPTGRTTGRTGGCHALLAAAEDAALDGLRAHTMRLDTRHDLVEARALYAAHGDVEIPACSHGPYAEHWLKGASADAADSREKRPAGGVPAQDDVAARARLVRSAVPAAAASRR